MAILGSDLVGPPQVQLLGHIVADTVSSCKSLYRSRQTLRMKMLWKDPPQAFIKSAATHRGDTTFEWTYGRVLNGSTDAERSVEVMKGWVCIYMHNHYIQIDVCMSLSLSLRV